VKATGQVKHGDEAALCLNNLGCRRGGQLLFAGLDLSLGSGGAALLTGPNGIGKSSLLRLVAGLLTPFAGSTALSGTVALCDERPALDEDRTLADALAFWTAVDGVPAAAITQALERFNIDHLAPVPVRMLSTGQRKRAALARTMLSNAEIWLLDEPANGLDVASVATLGEAVSAHRAAGGIVLAASHQPLPWPQDVVITLSRPEDPAA
jgi:heme exporter protein A